MERFAYAILGWLLIGGVLLCLGMLVPQHWLLAQTSEHTHSQITPQRGAFGAGLSAVSERVTKIDQEIGRGKRKSVAAAKQTVPRLSAHGLYVLETEVVYENRLREEERRRYTIYHLKAGVGSGADAQEIQIGIAIGGLSVPQCYIDYDNDGQVDADMMHEYVYYLPLGRVLAKSLDPYLAQKVYDAFLDGQDQAQFTSGDSIAAHGGEIADELWSFVQSSSDELAAWITKKLQGETPGAQPPAPQPI